MKNHGKRADFSVISNKSYHLLLSVEVKSKRTKRISDLVKLCRELKDAMKAIHSEGYSSVPICGILMKGNCCNIYIMDHIFDGLYRIAMIKRIYLPHDYYEMNQLLSIIPLFDKLKSIVDVSARILRNRHRSVDTRIPDDLVSMHTHTIVQTVKRYLDRSNPKVKNARRKLFLKYGASLLLLFFFIIIPICKKTWL